MRIYPSASVRLGGMPFCRGFLRNRRQGPAALITLGLKTSMHFANRDEVDSGFHLSTVTVPTDSRLRQIEL